LHLIVSCLKVLSINFHNRN